MRRVTIFFFHLLVGITPFLFSPATDELFEFNKMLFVYALTALITGSFLLQLAEEHRRPRLRGRLVFPTLLFVMSQVLSTIFSIDPHTSFYGYYSRFHGGLLSTLSYVLLFFVARDVLTRSEVRKLVRTIVIAGVFISLYALPEHFGVSPSCVLITNEWSVRCWQQDVQTRIFGTFGQPNWLAAYMIMLWPLALWLAIEPARAWWKTHQNVHLMSTKKDPQTSLSLTLLWPTIWPLVASGMFFLTLIYTRSRSGFLAWGVSVFVLVVGTILVWQQQRTAEKTAAKNSSQIFQAFLPPLFIHVIATTLAVVLILTSGTPFTPSLPQIIHKWQKSTPAETTQPNPTPAPTAPAPTTTVLENGGTDSGTIRKIVWNGAIKVWQRYPLLGSGVETFAYSYYRDRPLEHNLISEWDYLYNKAHNEFLNALATTGLIGIVALFALMGSFYLQVASILFRRSGSDLSFAFLVSALAAGYTGLAFSNALGFSTVMVAVLMFLFHAFVEVPEQEILLSTEKSSLKKSALAQQKKSSSDSVEVFNLDVPWPLFLGVIIGVLFLLARVWGMWQHDKLYATLQQQVDAGKGLSAYQTAQLLTRKAPREAFYWERSSLTLARLASGTAPQDATAAARLAQEALTASDTSIQLNKVHLNIWKSRIRVLLLLATFQPEYLNAALSTVMTARELAPTDVKLTYHQALILDALNRPEEADQAFRETLTLKPNYEQAHTSYGEFLEKYGRMEEALAQYRHILQAVNPTAPTALERVAALEASQSGVIQKTTEK